MSPNPADPGAERALLDRAVQGDDRALGVLAERHRPTVVRMATHILGNAESAEDVAQDAMVRLQVSLPGFRGDAELSTWLYQVTLNLCRDRLRKRRRRATHVGLDSVPGERLSSPAGAEDRIDRERTRAAVRAAIDRLPEDQREVVQMRYLSDLTYAEIVRRTGLPHGTVASRIFRGLKRLGQDLTPPNLEIV